MPVYVGAGRRFAVLALAALLAAAGCTPTPESALSRARSDQAEARARGIEELFALGEAGAPGLVALLREPATGKQARDALVRLGPRAVASLVAGARDAKQVAGARTQCVDVLGETKAAEAVAPLVALLSDPNLDDPAHFALASMGPSVSEPVAKALADPGATTRAREHAAAILATVKGPRALEALLSLMAADAPAMVKVAALKGLSSFEDPKADDAAIAALKERAAPVRKEAFDQFARNPDPRALDTLIALLQDPDAVGQAARGLAQLKDPRGFDRLAERAAQQGPGREEVVEALATSDAPEHLRVIVGALRSWDLAPTAAASLWRRSWKPGSPEEQTLFDAARRDKKALLARWAEVRPVLLADLKSKDGEAQLNAVRWLILLGKDEAVQPLLALFKAMDDDLLLATTLRNSGYPPLVKAVLAWSERKKVALEDRMDLPPIVWNRPPPD